MRTSDLLNIAIRTIRGKWGLLIVLGMAISVFCLCFAGTTLSAVGREKAAPLTLIVSAENSAGFTDTLLAEMRKIPNVEDVTPILEIPVQMDVGGDSAQLTLTGIKPSYLKNQGALPEESLMPYLLLNESACRLFIKNHEVANRTKAPEIDWLNAKATISMGEESASVTAKICGLLPDEKEDEAAAYISLHAAKALLRTNKQPTASFTAHVRVKNIGCGERVSGALAALQLTATNADAELQTKWDTQEKEMTSLIVFGTIGLLNAAVLLAAWRRLSRHAQKETDTMLHWLGMKEKDIARIFALQSLLLSTIGIGFGILAAAIAPSFLAP